MDILYDKIREFYYIYLTNIELFCLGNGAVLYVTIIFRAADDTKHPGCRILLDDKPDTRCICEVCPDLSLTANGCVLNVA